jgi:uncharacterized membrane protein
MQSDWVCSAGLNITALGVSYNERGYDDNFMKNIRKALDAAVAAKDL